MDKQDFEIGLRVELVVDGASTKRNVHNSSLRCGDTGTVVYISNFSNRLGVDWDKIVSGGHSCKLNGRQGHCWYVDTECLRPIVDPQLAAIVVEDLI